MKMADVYRLTLSSLKGLTKADPDKVYHDKTYGDYTCAELISGLSSIINWIHPELSASDVVKVVRCKDCTHYKRYRKKRDIKSSPRWLCDLDKLQKASDHYCKCGEERE